MLAASFKKVSSCSLKTSTGWYVAGWLAWPMRFKMTAMHALRDGRCFSAHQSNTDIVFSFGRPKVNVICTEYTQYKP